MGQILAIHDDFSHRAKSWLTSRCSISYHYWNKFALRSEPEFHAEWLRDEPYDATATDPGSYILDAGANSLLGTGNMRFGCELFCIR